MHRRDGACLSEHPHACASAHPVGNRLRHSLAWVDLTGTPEDGRSRLPSPRSDPLTRTPTPGFEPGSRPRQGRMIAGLHHVGMHGSCLESIELASSESNGQHPFASGDSEATRSHSYACGGRTYQRLSVRSARTGPHVHTALGCERKSERRETHPVGPAANATRNSSGECRRQARVPLPRTGSPRGGQVMRAAMSGLRRSGSR
jgi:hypothetical protein